MGYRSRKHEPIFYVYLKFDFNGIPRWVGKGKGKRAYEHEGFREKHWNHWMRKLVVEAYERGQLLPTVFLAENITEDNAFELERLWIKVIGRGKHGPLYNWTDGGEGVAGLVHSRKTINNMKGRIFSDESKARLKLSLASMSSEAKTARSEKQRKAKLGKKLSKSHKRKISAAQPKTRPPEFGQLVSAAKMGHEVSAETRAKISATKRARKRRMTDEEKAHLSKINTGRTYSPETIANYKASWNDPDIRERRRQGLIAAWVKRRARTKAEGESSP